jgi:hypothetical protein
MNESQIDLAHTVALGSIGDEDQRAVTELLGTADPALRADFTQEVQLTRDTLTAVAATVATPPPAALRARLLAAIAEDAAIADDEDQAPTAAGPHHPDQIDA